MDAAIESLLNKLVDGHEELRKAVVGAPPEALNWRPGENTNSLAVLVIHPLASQNWWIHIGAGIPPDKRDRDAELRYTADSVEPLLAALEAADKHQAEVLGNLTLEHLGQLIDRSKAPQLPPDAAPTITHLWCILHAIEHGREHAAHAGLTRQLWDQGFGR
ncbi:MAG TPA: DinB family protein [Dehalococcoidia bacterium]|nr:DinB family protein [Dehalococcoidia bacterium]